LHPQHQQAFAHRRQHESLATTCHSTIFVTGIQGCIMGCMCISGMSSCKGSFTVGSQAPAGMPTLSRLNRLLARWFHLVVYLPANHILHAPVLHCNGQVSPFIKAPEGSIGGIAASSIGTSLGGVRGPSGWAAPMGLDGFSLTPLQIMIRLLPL